MEEFQAERLHSKASVEEEEEAEEVEIEEEVEEEVEEIKAGDGGGGDEEDSSATPLPPPAEATAAASSPGSASNENVAEYLAVAFPEEEEGGEEDGEGLGAEAPPPPPPPLSSARSALTSLACLGSRTLQLADVHRELALLLNLCSLPAASLARTEKTQVPVPRPPKPLGEEHGSQAPSAEAPRRTTGVGVVSFVAVAVAVAADAAVAPPPACPRSSMHSKLTAEASPAAARNANTAPRRAELIGASLAKISAAGATVSTAKVAEVTPPLPLPLPLLLPPTTAA